MRPGSKLHRWISIHLGEMEISVAEQLTIEDIMRQIEVDLHLDLRWQREWLINQVYQLTEIECLGLAPARLAEFAAADCASAAAESALQRAEQAMLCSKREQVEMEQRKQQHRVTDKRQQQLLSIGLMLQQQRRTCRAAAGAAMAALAAWGAEVAAILAGDTARLAVWMLLCRRSRRPYHVGRIDRDLEAASAAAVAAHMALLALSMANMTAGGACAKIAAKVALMAAWSGTTTALLAEVSAEKVAGEQWVQMYGETSYRALYGGPGHQIMRRLGWNAGETLGRRYRWRTLYQPISHTDYRNREGLSASPIPWDYRSKHTPLRFMRSMVQQSSSGAAAAAASAAAATALTVQRAVVRCGVVVCVIIAQRAAAGALGMAAGAAQAVAAAAAMVAGHSVGILLKQLRLVMASCRAFAWSRQFSSLWQRRRLRHTSSIWHQHRMNGANRRVEGGNCLRVESGCFFTDRCLQWPESVMNQVRVLRPTEASSTVENLDKRQKWDVGVVA